MGFKRERPLDSRGLFTCDIKVKAPFHFSLVSFACVFTESSPKRANLYCLTDAPS